MKKDSTSQRCHSNGIFEYAGNHFPLKVRYWMALSGEFGISRYVIVLIIAFFVFGCNKLQIDDFSNKNVPENSQLLTQNYNFQRNAISKEELEPPLELVFIDDYNGMPSGSFTLVDSILFFGTNRGYLIAFDVNHYDELGKKKFGLSAPTPPTIYKNILYQTYDNGDYGLIAYDIIEGDKLWEIEDNLTSSTAIVVENKVYYQSNKGIINCVNYLTGENIWTMDLNCFGVNSIAYDNGILISSNQNGAIFALEYSSGVILWEKKLKDNIFANPVINENHVYVSTYTGFLYKINIENGAFVQSKKFNLPLYHGPTIDEHNVYIPTSDGRIQSLNKSDFIENWTNEGSGPAASSVVVSENYIYFPTLGKHLYILDKNTGEKLQSIKLEGRARSIPILKNGKLIIACEDENVNIFAISK